MSVTADAMHAPLTAPADDLAELDLEQEWGWGEAILTGAATTVAIIVVATIGVLLALV